MESLDVPAPLKSVTRHRAFPFVLVGVLALSVGTLVQPPVSAAQVAIDLGVAALSGAVLLVSNKVSAGRMGILVPLGFMVIIAFVRHKFGGSASGVATLYFLPIAWVALYRSLLDAVVTLVFLEVLMIAPILLYGAPDYPAGDFRRAVTMGLVAGTLAAMIRIGRRDSTRDPLTGLGNRRMWDEAVEQQFSRSARRQEDLVVAVIDLDDLKGFNDTRGHAACDNFLANCARAWREALRPEDVLVRAGGDEFFLMLPATGSERAATTVIERLRAVVPEGQTFSAGIATWDGEEDPDALMRRADVALYSAKEAGRNRIAVAAEDQSLEPRLAELALY